MRLIAFILIVFFSQQVSAQLYGSIIVSSVTSIYDGDTFRVDIAHYPDIIGKHISIRIKGVDAPEIRGRCASEIKAARIAKQFTVAHLRSARTIELRNLERGKYFRILANVYVDGLDLSKMLIDSGNARVYNGGKRLSWCSK